MLKFLVSPEVSLRLISLHGVVFSFLKKVVKPYFKIVTVKNFEAANALANSETKQ